MTILGVNLARAADDEAPVEIVQKIIIGKKVGKDDWPQYVPASFTLPAKRLIQVTVRSMTMARRTSPAATISSAERPMARCA